jgi:hypothetical protein
LKSNKAKQPQTLLDDGCGEITTTAGGTAGFRRKLLQLSRLQQETCLVEDAPLGRLITPGTSLLLLVPKLQFLLLLLRGRRVRWETEQETATHWAKAAVVVTPSMANTTGAGTKPPTTHMHIKQQEEKPNNKFFFYNNRQNCRDVSIYFCISISLSLSLFLRIENFLQHLVKEFWDFRRWVVLGAMEEVVGR